MHADGGGGRAQLVRGIQDELAPAALSMLGAGVGLRRDVTRLGKLEIFGIGTQHGPHECTPAGGQPIGSVQRGNQRDDAQRGDQQAERERH